MTKILFRADSSSTIGTGHIMRDLVLASQYKNTEIIFATQELNGNINHKIIEARYNIEILPSNDLKSLALVIEKYDVDMIVIDHYQIDYEFEKQLKNSYPHLKIMVFDDTYEKHYCDILLNHNIFAQSQRYKNLVPPHCEIRCGEKYTLLRDEFYQVKQLQKTKNEKFTLFLAMGGSDSQNLNIPILEVLKHFHNICINIITTTANKHLYQLQEYVQDKPNITLHINSNKVASLMYQSDFGILTPSVSVNEAYFLKVPFVAIQTEPNQKEVCNYLKQHNFIVLEQFNPIILTKKVQLIIDIIQSQLIPFQKLSLDEKKMILQWRNTPSISKWMYNKNIISLQEHLQYIESLDTKKDRVYFLVKKDDMPIGVVDLTQIKPQISAELGIYLNPNLKGYGKLLMHKIISYAFETLQLKTIYANVYKSNQKAIKLYEKFHFITQKTDEDFLYMELNNQ